jgi:lysophospholipase L1-like esterase
MSGMGRLNRRAMLAGSLGAGLALPAMAQALCEKKAGTPPALEPERLLTDWAWLARYRDDNARLISSKAKVHAVFLGDSITEGWASTDPGFFANGVVGRGISAQTTPQLLVRMYSDVIALRPRVVHIMAGTNDIAHNTGPMTAQDSKNNIMAMCEIAWSHKIRIVLGSVPPASKYWWRPEARPKAEALALNDWMRGYAKQVNALYADYAAALSDAQGNVKLELAKDEVHPTKEGYAAMRPIAEAALRIS